MKPVIVIPARYKSERLPGKPLIELLGVSMLRRTYAQCCKALPASAVYVATDDERIAGHCNEYGMQVVMTSGHCMTGTDRVAELANQIKADVYINVQGDEPVLPPDDILKIVAAAELHPGEIINGVCRINSDEEDLYRSRTIPKVVMRPDGRLLYMSRSPIPGNKQDHFRQGWRQVCIYAFPREPLQAFASKNAKTPLEDLEDIEVLRFLEMGYEVRMSETSQQSIAVDIPEDIGRAEAAIRERGLEFLD